MQFNAEGIKNAIELTRLHNMLDLMRVPERDRAIFISAILTCHKYGLSTISAINLLMELGINMNNLKSNDFEEKNNDE